jgi:tetratricopeptide (TPR) repeat protein
MSVVSTTRRTRPPNTALIRLIEASGASHNALAHRVNELAQVEGISTDYTHTSLANWCRRGMVPKRPVPKLLAHALSERLGRRVGLAELGMPDLETADAEVGLDFPREPADAVRAATSFWSFVNRRDFLGSSFAITAYSTPVTRWLITPADAPSDHRGGVRVGRGDVDELREAAETARVWDSRYGGGNWRANSVTDCLNQRATPLLNGAYTADIGQQLFSVTAELSRLAGWTAFDVNQHEAAQRHFIQALRLARAGGDIQLGCYVLTTMAMQALMRGFHTEAIDMAEGAYERAKTAAPPRVLAFTKLIEARAHARSGDAPAASRALAASETMLGRRSEGTDEPHWIDFYTHARLSADAAEIYRDLHKPREALAWHRQAAAMASGVYTRSVGMRLAIVATAHLQNRELDHGLYLGNKAVDILARVNSRRAHDYVRELNTALAPWRAEPQVREFLHRARSIGVAA